MSDYYENYMSKPEENLELPSFPAITKLDDIKGDYTLFNLPNPWDYPPGSDALKDAIQAKLAIPSLTGD